MRTFLGILGLAFLLSIVGCAETGTQEIKGTHSLSGPLNIGEKRFYTAYNIWIIDGLHMKCINYKFGHDILPAGTQVYKISVNEGAERINVPSIKFVTVDGDKQFEIMFIDEWHPGKTIEDYKNYMFTSMTFDELTKGMSEAEVESIRKGTVIDGMSKKAVLVSYGYPPEHKTPSLDGDSWLYWSNRFKTFKVCFDKDGKTITCP